MNRGIKFRGLTDYDNEVIGSLSIDSFGNHIITVYKSTGKSSQQIDHYSVKPETVGQSIGLVDKNGNEIYEGHELRCKYRMTDEPDCFVDAIYKVQKIDFEGVKLMLVHLYSDTPNSIENSFPINHSLSFYYRSLCTNSKNGNYNRIAINETHGENTVSGRSWIENHYSNDIEIFNRPKLTK